KLAESNAILWYVAEKLPGARLVPSDLRARARAHELCDFSAFYFYPTVYDLMQHTSALPKRIPEIADRARQGLERALGVLETKLSDGREHVAGPFSLADLACAA